VIAGISYWQFYFRLFAGSIKGPQIVEFLKALKAQIKRKLLIIWDGLGVHKSRLVREFIESLKGQIVEFLPAYAPSKEHCSGAYCPDIRPLHQQCGSGLDQSVLDALVIASAVIVDDEFRDGTT